MARTRRTAATLPKRSRAVEHRVEHAGCELSRERVLLAHVVRAEQRSSIGERDLRTVTELRLRPNHVVRGDRIPTELPEAHDDGDVMQLGELAFQIRTAGVAFGGRRLVRGRRAL